MKSLNIELAKKELEERIKTKFKSLNNLISSKVSNLSDQINLINQIRTDVYEDLNQLQHAYLLIKTAEYFQQQMPTIDKWEWHPFQTSGENEPDLRGYCNNKILINIEATTSQNPNGKIDTNMKKVLTKLDKHIEGEKYYVVQTVTMLNRANSKILNNNLIAKALMLP